LSGNDGRRVKSPGQTACKRHQIAGLLHAAKDENESAEKSLNCAVEQRKRIEGQQMEMLSDKNCFSNQAGKKPDHPE